MTKTVEVAIIGAGIAGSHLAGLLVKNGISTVLVDRRSLDKAGPHWINAVPGWMFDAAGVERPQGEELFDQNDRFIIRAPNKKTRLNVTDLGVLDVHMKHLGTRLKQNFIQQKGSSRVLEATIIGGRCTAGRLCEVVGETQEGKTITIKAKLFVDASGFKAALRKNHPLAERLWPNVTRENSCTAAQVTLAINDRHGALNYLESHHINTGDVLSDVGFMGGYSLFRSQIDHGLNHISLLCGVRALPQYDSAFNVIEQFKKEHPWIGTSFIEGRGAIPLNRPYHELVAPGLALLGDSACQVYSAHGSGIGVGLIAAKILADTICEAKHIDQDHGSIEVLTAYQRKFHEKYYKRLYFSEHFRKFSQNLDENRMIQLIESGVLSERLAKQTLMQDDPHLPPSSIKPFLRSAVSSPRVFASMLPVFSRAISGTIHAKRLSKKTLI
jgi:menaquinone-9 beta-reductase